jgi:dTDP-4-dehydrorhamnose reductase
MKLLVIGGSGLIGNHILREANTRGHDAIGTYRNFPLPGLVHCDCGDAVLMDNLLQSQKPDAVIYTAGWTWVDGCESNPERCFAENTEQPATTAHLCKKLGIHFSYFSSSYVFDGKAGPYRETDQPNPINVYARSKWEAEQKISQLTDGDALILRVICVYGAEAQKKNFAYQVWRAMKEGKKLRIPSDQSGNPTYAGDVARWLVNLIEEKTTGLRHLAGPLPDCTRPQWTDMLIESFQKFGVQQQPGFGVEAVPTVELMQPALRPLKAGLLSATELRTTDFSESIRQLMEREPLI